MKRLCGGCIKWYMKVNAGELCILLLLWRVEEFGEIGKALQASVMILCDDLVQVGGLIKGADGLNSLKV